MKKRIISLLLVLAMALSLLPAAVFAEEKQPDAAITVPADATLFVGVKGQVNGKDTHFVAFSEVQAAEQQTNAEASTTTYYFDLTNDKQYNYRVSGQKLIVRKR